MGGPKIYSIKPIIEHNAAKPSFKPQLQKSYLTTKHTKHTN